MYNHKNDIVKSNDALYDITSILLDICSNGTVYLQGGYLRDYISYKINKIPPQFLFADFDFAIDCPDWDIASGLEQYGSVRKNFFGGMKWVPHNYPEIKIDLWFIKDFWHLRDTPGQYDIDDFFNGVDFTFNQVALDIRTGNLYNTQDAIKSIANKEIKLVSTKRWANKESIFVRLYYFMDKLNGFSLHKNCIDFYFDNKDNFEWGIIYNYAKTKNIEEHKLKQFDIWLNNMFSRKKAFI